MNAAAPPADAIDLVKRAARRRLILILAIGVPMVALGVAAMLGRGFAAQRDGDEATATSVFVGGAAALIVVFTGAIVYIGRVLAIKRRRLDQLRTTFPTSIAVLLHSPVISVRRGPAAWTSLKPTSIHAVLIDPTTVSIVRFDRHAAVIATTERAV